MARVRANYAYATVAPDHSALIADLFDAGTDLHWDTWGWGRGVGMTPRTRPSADAALLVRPTSRRKSIPCAGSGTNL